MYSLVFFTPEGNLLRYMHPQTTIAEVQAALIGPNKAAYESLFKGGQKAYVVDLESSYYDLSTLNGLVAEDAEKKERAELDRLMQKYPNGGAKVQVI